MAKNEAKTDFWVHELLKDANIHLTPQGCDIKEIAEALKTASKSKTGKDKDGKRIPSFYYVEKIV